MHRAPPAPGQAGLAARTAGLPRSLRPPAGQSWTANGVTLPTMAAPWALSPRASAGGLGPTSSSGNASTSAGANAGNLSPTAARILSNASAGPARRPASGPSGLILPSSARGGVVTPAAATAPAASAPTSAPRSSPAPAPPTTSHSAAQPSTSGSSAPAPAPSGYVSRHGMDAPYVYLGNQRVHSLSDRGKDVIRGMAGWADTELPRYLKSSQTNWQPADLLPDSASPDFFDQVAALRAAAAELPNDYLVVLVGDMVTEEALPSYMNMLNTLDETRDESGASSNPWARWTREWTAEENRHGDVLNKYLYLCGKVDMRAVETTIQRLIGSGLDPQLENNPYLCFVYTSFQERATRISHGNTARLALYHGDAPLAKLCGLVAGDEARHEAAYSAIVSELFARDPDGAMLAFADMMKKGIVMPAHFVDDGWHTEANGPRANLFVDYATVADAIGVYTTNDYADIIDHLVQKWNVSDIRVESGEAAEAQEYLMKHAERIRRLSDLQAERRLRDRKRGKTRTAGFSWISKREVALG